MIGNRRPVRWCIAMSAALAFATGTGVAGDLVPRAGLGVAWSDNPLRDSSGNRDETVLAADVGFDWQRTGPRVLSDINGRYTRREFLQNTFDPENLFSLAGFLDAVIVPGRLDWVVEENFGQVAALSFGAILPVDRENTNYFTTGPNLSFDLSGGDTADVFLRFSDVYYSESDTDNQRVGGQVSYARAISPRRTLSANAYAGRIVFDKDDVYPDVDVQQVYLRLESAARRMTLAADIGWNSVEFRGVKDSGTYASVSVFRQVNPETLISLEYSRGFSNSADAFRIDQSSLETSSLDEDIRVVADPFDEDRLTASYQLTRAKVDLRANLYASRERYLSTSTFDRDQVGLEARLAYRISSLTTLAVLGRTEDNKLVEGGDRTRDTQWTLEAEFQVTQKIVARLAVERYERNTQTGVLPEFVENRVFAGVAYAPPLPPRPTRDRSGRSLRRPVLQPSMQTLGD